MYYLIPATGKAFGPSLCEICSGTWNQFGSPLQERGTFVMQGFTQARARTCHLRGL